MKKDREYITELFDNDGIKAPDSLSEENMLAMLEKAEEKQAQESPAAGERKVFRPSRSFMKRAMALAAAAVIAVFGISSLADIISRPPDTSEVDGELYTFGSEREIKQLLKSLNTERVGGIKYRNVFGGDADSGLIEYEAAPDESYSSDSMAGNSMAAGEVSSSKAAGSAHSDTYLQVEGIDEADIVKTDGKYIYYVNTDKEVVILSADNGKTEKVSVIGYSGVENYIDDIYLSGDRLITVGRYYKDDSDESSSGIVVYDISDRSKPKELYDFSQTGIILSSRMVGDYVYLVTNDYVYKGGRALPYCGGTDSLSGMKPSDICCLPDPKAPSYLVLSAVDVSTGTKGKTVTKAILGAGDTIYCNDHNLYSVTTEWDEKDGTTYTRIVRAALDGADVKFNATARVRGYVDSQFSMDEKDGYFRIATTSERGGMDVNNLFVLDKSLREAGKVTGFARNESIKAVRFMGDKAYVITYEAIDPLFIIDLADPENPVIEGEVMIDGFSTLLIPVGDGRLLGIGHATGDNGYGGEFDSGLKLALFDISDPSHPKVLDSKEFEDMTSFAQNDHHALMVNNEAGYFAIPYDIYRYDDEPFPLEDDVIIEDDALAGDAEVYDDSEDDIDETEPEESDTHEAGILVFKADDSIGAVDQHALGSSELFRSVYIGDWIYALDAKGNVQSFKPGI